MHSSMRYIKKSVHIGLNIVLLLLLLVILGLGISRFILHDVPPSLFGYAPVDVLTGSMKPVFSPGDIIVIHKQNEYEVNDIVTYSYQDALITHRIVKETEDGFMMKGDANNVVDDEMVKREQIVGKYLFVIPFIGSLRLWITSPFGIIFTVMIIVGIYFYIRKRKEESE